MDSNLKKYQPFFQQNWYIQKFNATPNLLDIGARSGFISCWRDLGYGYEMFINIYRSDFCAMHYHEKSLRRIYKEIVKHRRHDKKYLDKVRKLWLGQMNVLAKNYLNKELNLSHYTFPELIKIYQEFYKHYFEACGIAHILEGITLTTDIELKNQLLEALRKRKNAPRLGVALPILTAPIQDTFFNKEQRSLAKLINYVRNDNNLKQVIQTGSMIRILRLMNKKSKFKKMLDSHVKYFHWIRNSYAGAINLSAWDFLREIREFIRLNKDLIAVPVLKPKTNYLAKKTFIKKWQLSRKIQELIYLTDFMTAWQDERKEYTLRGVAVNEKFLAEIGRRLKIPLALMRYLLINESTVENLRKIKKSDLTSRRKGCVVMASRRSFDIIFGKLFNQIVKRLASRQQAITTREINGLPGSAGKVMGKVKICFNLKDMHKIKEGDILVTSMTRPEYMPAIKKAAGIVTDEGGITCHAAIISRELGKPCVIGTKIATKSLKDGDMVELNGNHGLVKVIK